MGKYFSFNFDANSLFLRASVMTNGVSYVNMGHSLEKDLNIWCIYCTYIYKAPPPPQKIS
jgi:hypothetical protein